MLELIATIMLQEVGEAQPVESPTTEVIEAYPGLEAECQYYGDINGQVIENLQAVCPSQAPYFDQLQARADAIIASIPQPVSTEYSFLRSNLLLTWDGEDWVLKAPLALHRSEPNYPPRAAERGLNGICAGLVEIYPDGSAEPQNWECRAFRSNGRPSRESSVFLRASMDAVEENRYVSETAPLVICLETSLTFQLLSGGFDSEPDLPDLENLFPSEERPQCPPSSREGN